MKNKNLVYLILVLFIIQLCNNLFANQENNNEKFNCVMKLVDESVSNPLYSEVRNGYIKAYTEWKNMKLEYANPDNMPEYIPTIMCFNLNKSKAVMFLLVIDTSEINERSFLNLISCEKDDSHWEFYADHRNYLIEDTVLDKHREISVKRVIDGFDFGILEAHLYYLISEVFFINERCEINEDFINNVFLINSTIESEKYRRKQLPVPKEDPHKNDDK